MSSPQFTLYSHAGGPNGWKVAIVLEELGLTYHTIFLDFGKKEQKAPEYTKYNPNGRIPTLIDHHNNDFTLWESGAIIQYLVDTYDKEHKISVTDPLEKYRQLQWLYFQGTGQGPYFGQCFWFNMFHHEKVESAVERYTNEFKRVLSVLDSVLAKQQWLVDNKPTVADFVFVTWNDTILNNNLPSLEGFKVEEEYPSFAAWHARLGERPTIQKIRADRIREKSKTA